MISTQLLDTNGDNFNDTALFSFSNMTYINDTNPNNHLITGVVQAAILPKSGTVNGTTIITNAQYAYGLAINLTSSVTLTTFEPMITVAVGLNQTVNTVFYQVIYLLCSKSSLNPGYSDLY